MKQFFSKAWTIAGVAFFFLILIELVSGFLLKRLDSKSEPRQEMHWAESDSYASADWIPEYMKEYSALRMRWEPYVYWRRKPFAGAMINVGTNGLRKTANPVSYPSATNVTRIFVFGGSTVWGEGVRDHVTIPSLLSAELARRGIAAQVINYAEGGYVSTQEFLALLNELHHGNRPDLAIFYNGLNDMYSAAQSGEAGIPQNEWNRVAEFNVSSRQVQVYWLALFGERTGLHAVRLMHRLAARHRPDRYAELRPGLNRDVVTAYYANMRAIDGLAKAYGFRVLLYWQPVLYNKRSRTAFEEKMIHTQPEHFQAFFSSVEALIREQGAQWETCDFHYIGDLFEHASQPLYIDFSHISEEGNHLVAERISRDVALMLMSGGAE